MQYISADCIIPVTGKPRYNSLLALTDDGSVEGIYYRDELKGSLYEIHNFTGILCPGFVNTHCHLELSWAKGLITEGKGLDAFIQHLDKFRKSATESSIMKAISDAASKMEQSGIVATADIANGDHTLEHKRNSRHYFQTFAEVFGSDPAFSNFIFEKAIQLNDQFESQKVSGSVSIAPHATYSLSEDLFKLVASYGKGKLISIHHQENTDENYFFKDGSGPIAARRKAFNPGLPDFEGTGKRPLESIAGYFDSEQRILLVHNTVTEQQDIDFADHYFSHASWCMCPNANLFIENKLPNIDLFRSNNCRISLGTDSLASNHQLSILEEIKTIQKNFPEIGLSELMRWGTLNGAEVLGLGQCLGSFEKGKSPGVVLIENVDIDTLQLTPSSTSRLIIPART
jgi:aminodeoxyfutalosine deaminase